MCLFQGGKKGNETPNKPTPKPVVQRLLRFLHQTCVSIFLVDKEVRTNAACAEPVQYPRPLAVPGEVKGTCQRPEPSESAHLPGGKQVTAVVVMGVGKHHQVQKRPRL